MWKRSAHYDTIPAAAPSHPRNAQTIHVFRRRNRLHKRDLSCRDYELCVSYDAEVGCMDEYYDVTDEAGSVVNLVTGDFELPDGTTGNTITGDYVLPDSTTGSSSGSSSSSSSSSDDNDESSAIALRYGSAVGMALALAAMAGLA
ncbi:hypothetical protein MKZ38_008655 [Zalerion maritima]|uniref:Uncharacterized protein n=1 Tax=Zalerion maritima TaxID=339359 RepID=A0AAD5RKR4_9PEZI|nr:hypothetical protein MKZ38_008655 [Zalerion maritima]